MSADGLFRVDGCVAVVTGAHGKLGGFWVETLLESGAAVAALDCTAECSEVILKLIHTYGPGRLRAYRADVTSRLQLQEVKSEIESDLGPATILVNNAGIDQPPSALPKSHRLGEVPYEDFLRVIEVNLAGCFNCIEVFAAAMKPGSRVINIGSLYASVSPDARLYDHIPVDPPFLKPVAYGASKAGLINLTRYYAAHLGPKGIRVNALSPGGVQGGQDPKFVEKFVAKVPLGRMATFNDLAGPLLFLASEASAYITGHELRVEGGFVLW